MSVQPVVTASFQIYQTVKNWKGYIAVRDTTEQVDHTTRPMNFCACALEGEIVSG
jgi:hypothetical protein